MPLLLGVVHSFRTTGLCAYPPPPTTWMGSSECAKIGVKSFAFLRCLAHTHILHSLNEECITNDEQSMRKKRRESKKEQK